MVSEGLLRDFNSPVGSEHSAFFAKQRTTRRKKRIRRTIACTRTENQPKTGRERRIEFSRPTTCVRRLLAVPLIAAIIVSGASNTNDKLFFVCDAFAAPTVKSKIFLRPEQRIMTNARIRKFNQGAARTISRIIDTNTRIRTTSSLSSNTPTSQNGRSGGASNNGNNQNNAEVAGLILAIGIILSLAGMSGTSTGGIVDGNEVTSTSVAVMTKVVENTVPTTSTEVVAVTLGESIGGVIGAVISVAINFVLRGGKNKDDSSESMESNNTKNTKNMNKQSLLSQGLSDGDYFIANSASFSLLEAVGVPESVAKYSSIFIAAIPSQLVKIGSRISEQKRAKEDEILYNLLREDQKRKKRRNLNDLIPSMQGKNQQQEKKIVDPKELVPVTLGAVTAGETAPSSIVTVATESPATAVATSIDVVEIFADVTRWLEYDVLKTEYGEIASSKLWMVEHNLSAINPLQSAITFALLGSLAAVSSRWYADILYGRFCYGPIEKQHEVRTRNDAEWFSLYSSTAASAAALFGCYEFFQLPIGRYIQGTLAGGVEGCVGSSRFDACMQTYIDTNSPGPTAEAQIRALVTNLYAVYIRLQDIAGDTTTDDMSALIRAWSVSIASYIANM
mmetsp:Transcript_28447/g.60970  ORF Transcript_28447/g.60970 Transcript_28447/m.60970 type:complete len:619 (-) Transcript_28447:26-1882(-)